MVAATPWQNRIVGYGDEAPDQLLANPKNAAVIHPRAQQDALTGVLREIGIVQNVVVNRRSGMVVDGHMRIAAAISAGQPSIPVTYVDLSDSEETAILATMDPISAMRQYDRDELDILLKQVEIDDAAVQQMLNDLAAREGLYLESLSVVPDQPDPPTTASHQVTCPQCGHEFAA